MFRSLHRVDGTLLWINLALLGFVALLPFPTQVLGSYGDTTIGTVVYAAAISVVGSLSVLVGWYIVHAGLTTPAAASQMRHRYAHGLIVVAVFGLSIPVAVASPAAAKFCWLLIIPLGFVARRWLGSDDDG